MQNSKLQFKISKIQNFKFLAVIFSFSFFAFSLAIPALAAVLYLEPAEGEYYQNDTFLVDLRIDTEAECINTVKANLSFSQDILKAVDFSRGKSILTLWLEVPKINQEKGLISFIGGIPGGFCGILPGDTGKSNLLGSIVFQIIKNQQKEERKAKVRFLDSSQVLLNDGLGTLAELKIKEANFKILTESTETPKEEWKEELGKDNLPPEPFEIKIGQEPSLFEGKYFIVFHTTDKQSGIDHYEIAEQRGTLRGITQKIEWKRGESPYLLEDQELKSIIKVKAVDKAGNERIAEYPPSKKITWKDIIPWIILVLVGGGIISWLIRKSKIKSQKLK